MRFKYLMEFLLTAMLLLAGSSLTAQSVDKKAASAASPCTDADFWVGEWEVKDMKGQKDATANIKFGLNHCSVTEEWISAKREGEYFCFMAYSNHKHNWEYLCANSTSGDRLRYSGGVMHGNELRFVEDDLVAGTVHNFSYFNLPDGRIRELSVSSSDAGKTWKTDYDAIWYRKK